MNTTSTFNNLDENDHKSLFVTLLSNGGDDLPKMGVGRDEQGVFIVDLHPDDSPIKVKTYVKKGLDVLDVVKLGVHSEVFEEWASDDIRFRVDKDLQAEWDVFCNSVFEEV